MHYVDVNAGIFTGILEGDYAAFCGHFKAFQHAFSRHIYEHFRIMWVFMQAFLQAFYWHF